MANYQDLKDAIKDVVKTNENQEITGQSLQNVLLTMISTLGQYYDFAGVANPDTNPGNIDQNIFYIACTPGIYLNMGGFTISENQVAFLKYNGQWEREYVELATLQNVKKIEDRLLDYVTQISPTKYAKKGYYNQNSNSIISANDLYQYVIIPVQKGQKLYVKNNREDNHNYFTDKDLIFKRRVNCVNGINTFDVLEDENLFIFGINFNNGGDANLQDIWTLPKGSEELQKLSNALKVDIKKSDKNILNPNLYKNGIYLNESGIEVQYDFLSVSDFIPVNEEEIYTLYGMQSNGTQGNVRYVNFFNENKQNISGTQESLVSAITIPIGCKYIRCCNYNGNPQTVPNIYDLSDTGVFLGEDVAFEKYETINVIYKSNLSFEEKTEDSLITKKDILLFDNNKKLTVNFNNPYIKISNANDYIEATLNRYFGKNPNYDGNPMFNFSSWNIGGASGSNGDDVAPMHVQNTTIGANHAQPCVIGTINAHGRDNTDIGTEWTHTNGKKFYIMRIVDGNKIVFLSENQGTAENQSFVSLTTGTLTKGSETMEVTEVTGTQLYESVFNVKQKVMQNGVTEITEAQTFGCDFVDIVEEYDIVNTAEVLNNIIARAGQSGDPIYTSSPMMHVENIYRFFPNLSVIVISNVIAKQNVKFQDLMFTQAIPVGVAAQTKYYVPNSLPVSGYDFRKPLTVNWGSSIPEIFFASENWADENNPVNRVVQIAQNVGFAIGFIKDAGVGKDLKTYTRQTFELRNNTGKVYPHGVDFNKQGNTLNAGQMFTAIMYRCFFSAQQPENRISTYNCTFNGYEYVFVDFAETSLDHIVVNSELNGKKIEVVERKNTELKTDVYNDGFYVNANYVEDETCYIIVRIG